MGDLGAPGLLVEPVPSARAASQGAAPGGLHADSRPPVLEAGSPRSRCQQGRERDLPQAPLLDLRMAISSWGRHKVVSLCLGPRLPSYEDPSPHGVRAPDHLCTGPFPGSGTSQGIGAQAPDTASVGKSEGLCHRRKVG